jgi:hypothetical protein
MRVLIKFIIVLLSFISLSAQVIDKIEVSGNRNFSSSDYTKWAKVSRVSKVFPALANYIL